MKKVYLGVGGIVAAILAVASHGGGQVLDRIAVIMASKAAIHAVRSGPSGGSAEQTDPTGIPEVVLDQMAVDIPSTPRGVISTSKDSVATYLTRRSEPENTR